jgi:hypothetical protein
LIIREPGIYEMHEADYHADPCVKPSLSRSILKRLVDLSPAHAYCLHPRLGGLNNPDAGSDDEVMDVGSAAHASFLQNRSIIQRVDFPDWRTKLAKEARAAAYVDGMIPLLTKAYGRAMRLIDVLEAFRARTGAFTQGKAEQTVIWRDGPIWCRARVDWLPDNPEAALWDLKTTAGAASLGKWSRAAFENGGDLQASFYARGVEMVRGEPPDGMKFCVVEQNPPHAIAVFEMTPVALDIAGQKVRAGLSLWENCLDTGIWPGYPDEPQYVHPPSWIVREWEERAGLSPRVQDLMRQAREIPIGVQMVETGDFAG